MPGITSPLVSCLCVTEGRPAFMPWLLWCFDRQRWSPRELVIIDSSPEPVQVAAREDIRVLTTPPGTGVARKRNLALQEARGDIVTWFDDDDWQHPHKLEWLVEALRDGGPYAGATQGWFVELTTLYCTPYRGSRRHIVFNSAGFRREAVLPQRFQEDLRRSSDTRWMWELAARYRNETVVLPQEAMFFWLCHAQNLSNPAKRRRFSQRLDVLKSLVGTEAWGDTDDALNALRTQVQGEHGAQRVDMGSERRAMVAVPTMIHAPPQDQPRHDANHTPGDVTQPPVGLMIKATVLDALFLDVMVRHMIAQARYAFAERTIVVDQRPAFTGKYRIRPQASREELDRVLEKLLEDGVVDHVRDVDMTSEVVAEIMGRYFEDARRVPTHAATGGPIYATLFGLESMSTDFVLQMDADVFFHTGSESWVRQALAYLIQESQIWLMMTHPGPPAGPPGRSLALPNARRASWDQEHCIWRFQHATTRYFLCDRRKLHRRLRPVILEHRCAPLEQCISAALQRHNGFRGALGNLQSWHLHGWYHGDPFPRWAPSLAQAIAAGDFPDLQRGEYDLRLDRERDRTAWQAVLERRTEEEVVDHVHPRQRRTVIAVSPLVSSQRAHATDLNPAGVAPIAVVIPVRDRAGPRLRNALSSLNWQAVGRPTQIVVVSHGSQPEVNRELQELCDTERATLIMVGDRLQPWNKPFALNTGIRATLPEVPFVMTMDADMILAANFLTVVLERLQREPPALVLCRISDLPQHVSLPSDRATLRERFERFHAMTRLRPCTGTGGIQAARRSFYFDIRGYDEDLLWWGAMDGDLVNRARLAGLQIEWIENWTAMLHQWHPRKYTVLTDRLAIGQAQRAWLRNHALVQSRAMILQRNPHRWGGMD
jgi:glycosyltransferase involved in cell wall biosynthesis